MNGTWTSPAQAPEAEAEGSRRSLWQVFADLFEKNPLANGIMIFAIVIGFFHGWLKIKYRSPLTTFAFDIPIVLTMAVTLLTRRKESLFPNSPVGDALKFHTFVCLLYVPLSMMIWDVYPLAVVASFRGWCVIPLIFLVGYHLSTSIRQVEFYMWMMVGLGFLTAIYGINQSEDEVRRLMLADPELEYRFRNQFYAVNGVSQFRRFSTYVSAAAFAAQLAYSTMFAFSRLSVKTCPSVERFILAGMAGVMTYALILTGARSGLLQLVAGVLVALWYRRGGIGFLLLPIVFTLAWKAGIATTSGGSTDRFSSLLQSDTVWSRFWIVLEPSVGAFLDAPFGTGLGSSSHGVPMFLVSRLKSFRPIDGDLGHLVVDMGFIGLVTIGFLFFQCSRCAVRWMVRLRDTPVTVVALPAGIFIFESILAFPIGTPFLGIPYGYLLWFFFGCLSRMSDDYEVAVASGVTSTVRFREKFTSFIAAPKMRPLFRPEPVVPGSSLVPVAPAPSAMRVVGIVAPSASRVGADAPAPGPSGGQSPRNSPAAKRFLFQKKPRNG